MSTWEDLPAWTRSSGAGLAPAAGMVQSVLLAGMPRGCRRWLPPARQRKFKNEKLGSLLNSGSFPSDKGQVCIFLVIFGTVLNLGKTSSAQLWVGFDSASFGHVPSPSPHTRVSLQCALRSCRPEGRHRNDAGPFPGGTEIHWSQSCPGACTPIRQRSAGIAKDFVLPLGNTVQSWFLGRREPRLPAFSPPRWSGDALPEAHPCGISRTMQTNAQTLIIWRQSIAAKRD